MTKNKSEVQRRAFQILNHSSFGWPPKTKPYEYYIPYEMLLILNQPNYNPQKLLPEKAKSLNNDK